MRLLPAMLLGCASCAQVFGLDNTTGRDADPSRVTLTMQRLSLGATVDKNTLDVTSQTGAFYVDDGAGGLSKVPANVVPPDQFSAPIATGVPAVMVTLPDQPTPYRHLYATPSRDQRGTFVAYEHANAQPPASTSMLQLQVNLPSAYVSSESFRVEAIGAWATRPLMAAELPLPDVGAMAIGPTVAYSSFSRMIGNAPITKITTSDAVLVERYVSGNQLTGVLQGPMLDQTAGTDVISGNMLGLTANLMYMASVTPTTYSQRLSAVRPAVSGLGMSWQINGAPGYAASNMTGVMLRTGGVAATDTTITAMYANPFQSLSWRSLAAFSAAMSRTFMFGGIAMGLSASMYTVAEPTGPLTYDFPAGLPISLRVDLLPLTTDGQTVALDLTKPVVFDAQTDRMTNTYYALTLYEVALSSDMTAVVRTPIVDAVTTGEAKFTLPSELFQIDHYYYVNFRSVQGLFANAAMGDFQTYSLPFSSSQVDGAVFKVVMP